MMSVAGGDAKLFARGKVAELRAELNSGGKKDKNHSAKKIALKRIVANMTMSNNDMVALFPDIVGCMQIPSLEIKKMCFLFLVNYARLKPDVAMQALPILVADMDDVNPLVRALALRTMSYIHVREFVEATMSPLKKLLKDPDPYVRKTACFTVAKIYDHDRVLVEGSDVIDRLNLMLRDGNPTVVASALAALMDIWERSDTIKLTLDYTSASKVTQILPDCSEWGQTYILEALMSYVPQDTADATLLAERISPRLSHSNSSVVLTCIRVILYLMNYISDPKQIQSLCRKLSPPLVTLLAKGPEVQYLALRNALLILQRWPEVLRNDVRVFFCKYNDPIYVKVTKLELIFMLATEQNINEVLTELREYATEIDVHFVRKSVRAIGKLAIKIEPAARLCINTLLELVATKVSYIVQEATVVIKNIFRKYPNQYESIISTLCENLDSLDEPEAKAAMIWVIGQYAHRIDNSDVLLDDFLYSFADETVEVQLALLTATVKLFIQRPTKGQQLVPKVLKWATEETDNPDLRDRGFMYWRLLSSDPNTAKQVVLGEKPPITAESEKLDPATLEELCLNVGTLATVYLKPVHQVFRSARPRRVQHSPALQFQRLPTFIESQQNLHKNLPDMMPITNAASSLGANPAASATTAAQLLSPTTASTAMPIPGTSAAYQNGQLATSPSSSAAQAQQQRANLAAAVDAADLYFAGVGSSQMAAMGIVANDGFGSPPPVLGGAAGMFASSPMGGAAGGVAGGGAGFNGGGYVGNSPMMGMAGGAAAPSSPIGPGHSNSSPGAPGTTIAPANGDLLSL
ncbi:Adaptor protein complex beta subunit [Xylona heveae TC161]|uniref:AP complex subunit beta n=1 Tax=Xylona heveae (strain CBS 132557 / TC161) TaxID=1328760 RepID=A0A165IXZ2_XYLHT|nr:Adaptor protein complex beta subunit [Xylona heveae TC161]KZF25528.1 Adaptor protein complex beta subunit [Xylona heveae TC161]